MKKILVIEDDLVINQNIHAFLQTEGFDVVPVYDGTIASKALLKNDFSCVVMDVNLPHKNGYELCREFRTYNTLTPILMLTAFDEIEDKIQGFDAGADDYLTKPFYMKELSLRIHSLLKRHSQPASTTEAIVTAGDIMVNTKNKKITRQGIEVLLTPREYQILVRLIHAKGELVSKKDLVAEIWGSSFDANTNTIEVFINFLRKKIDKPFGKDTIKTKIGYGYYMTTDEHSK